MANARELFITGLKNAHSMERNAQEMLERQVERLDHYPELKSKLSSHLDETKRQLGRLEQCLSDCGSSPSTVKDTVQSLGANMAAVGHAMADDEVLKNTFASSALEHYEIAAYKSLLAMADAPAYWRRRLRSSSRWARSSAWPNGSMLTSSRSRWNISGTNSAPPPEAAALPATRRTADRLVRKMEGRLSAPDRHGPAGAPRFLGPRRCRSRRRA